MSDAETIANALEAGRTHAIERRWGEKGRLKLAEIEWDIALIERAQAIAGELTELRAERDALLQKPIDLAKMDSIDDDATDRMIAYYWHQQAQDARARLERAEGALKRIDDRTTQYLDPLSIDLNRITREYFEDNSHAKG
jgi:hypothetical protein